MSNNAGNGDTGLAALLAKGRVRPATLVVFVAAGHGVALVPQSVQSLRLDGVTDVPLAETETIDLVLARRVERSSPAAQQVASVIEQCVHG
ncbi:type 2 periplasmic-binding domain-containing protein [Streptomyces acidicola]|uniref:hypothetical protein n=1 Tax=Streptomyces acidicola TaxID=2596892 RepID=UPI003812CE3A